MLWEEWHGQSDNTQTQQNQSWQLWLGHIMFFQNQRKGVCSNQEASLWELRWVGQAGRTVCYKCPEERFDKI